MMKAARKPQGPMHHLWGALEFSSSSGLKENESLDSIDEVRKLKIASVLEDVVQHSESFASELSDSDQDVIDANDVRAKIKGVQKSLNQGKGSSGDAKIGTLGEHDGEEEAEHNAVGSGPSESDPHPALEPKQNVAGRVRPCHYFHTKAGCSKGADCTFSHDQPKRIRPRPCKSNRTRCKQLAGLLDTMFAADPDQMNEAAEILRPNTGKSKEGGSNKLVGILDNMFDYDPDKMNEAVEIVSSQKDYLRKVVRSKVRDRRLTST